MAEGAAGIRAPRNREGPIAGAMAVARWDAAVPPIRKRFMGDPDGPADETDGARAALPVSRAPCRAARVYQENANDTRR
jgi:hypothetical protein